MRRASIIGLGLLLATALAATSAWAYELAGGYWAREDQPVRFRIGENLDGDLSDDDSVNALLMGYNAWTFLPCSWHVWEFDGRTNNTSWGSDDGENILTWLDNGWDDSSGVLAITMMNGGGSWSDTDIKFNGVDHSWRHYPEADQYYQEGATDIASVNVHEVGHAVGLGHTYVDGSTMLPSIGAGDTTPRTLGEDDIAGGCNIYGNGEPIPNPNDLPPPSPGLAEFGEDCRIYVCDETLLCVTSGAEQYCTMDCALGDASSCPEGYFCAQLAGGSGACAQGSDPNAGHSSFGGPCGELQGCQPGLRCVSDLGDNYCTSDCQTGCPEEFECTGINNNGGEVCARRIDPASLPGFSQPCNARGLCGEGLICLTGANGAVPSCSRYCDDGVCPDNYACVDVRPSGRACQFVPPPPGDLAEPNQPGPIAEPTNPGAGSGEPSPPPELPPAPASIGSACNTTPGEPACAENMVCIDTLVVDGVLAEAGTCTLPCSEAACCPAGFGCRTSANAGGRCRANAPDSPELVCGGVGAAGDVDEPGSAADGEGGGGCASAGRQASGPGAVVLVLTLLLLAAARSPRRSSP